MRRSGDIHDDMERIRVELVAAIERWQNSNIRWMIFGIITNTVIVVLATIAVMRLL